MHKRHLLFMLISLVAFAQAKAESTGEVKGAHPFKTAENTVIATECSHWSLIWNLGFNSFDGDFNSEMKHPVWIPSVGMGVEYSFTPSIALGVEYMYDMYRVEGTPSSADILLKGQMHKADAYLAWDLMTQFFPRAKRKIFSLQVLLGGGAAAQRYDIAYEDDTRGNTQNSDAIKMDKFRGTPFLIGGVNFEFNLSRSIALGIRGEYTYFTRDDLDGRGTAATASKNNDGLFDVNLNLRYKIDAVHKTHVRNIPSERILDAQLAQKPEKKEVTKQLPAAKDTIVIYHKDTVVYKTETQTTQVRQDDYYFVYFDNGKSKLSKDGMIAVQQIATRMDQESQSYAVIVGYCDNTGTEALNNTLSDARAEAVANELIDEFNVAPDHIATCGKGMIVNRSGKRSAYTPNRRAEVRLVSAEEFEQFRQECKTTQQNRRNVTSAQKQQNETAAPQELSDETTIVVDKGVTLAKLARQYYNNTHCWVFLYKANKTAIDNPNSLKPGTKLVIPVLTDEQLKITKSKCLELYTSIR